MDYLRENPFFGSVVIRIVTAIERSPDMAIPITPTPVLEGEEAEKFWDKVETEKNKRLDLISTPKLEELRRKIVNNAKRRQK